MREVRGKRLKAMGLLVVVAIVGAACQPLFGVAAGPVRYGVLTSPTGETFQYGQTDGTLTVSVPTSNIDGNVRQVFWQENGAWYADQQDCVTWLDAAPSGGGQDAFQPGIAMRIAPTVDGKGMRAITVTENIWFGALWTFWVDVWDSTNTSQPFTPVESFDLSSIVGMLTRDGNGNLVGGYVSPPWHICGRTHGDQFSFKVWTGTNPEPSWSDPTHVFTTTLPPGWNYPGRYGDYVGHLHAGQVAQFADQSGGVLCLQPDTDMYSDCVQLRSALTSTTTSSSTSLAPSSTTAPPTTTQP